MSRRSSDSDPTNAFVSCAGTREAVRAARAAARARGRRAERCKDVLRMLEQRIRVLKASAIEIAALERPGTSCDASKRVLDKCVAAVVRCIALARDDAAAIEAVDVSFEQAERETSNTESHMASEIAAMLRKSVAGDVALDWAVLWATFRAWCEAVTDCLRDESRDCERRVEVVQEG